METTGNIKAVKQREKNYSLLIETSWYSGFGKTDLNKGDSVKILWEQNGEYKNIKSVELIKKLTESHQENRDDKTAVMLTSYVKDIYIAFLNKGNFEGKIDAVDMANLVSSWYNLIRKEINADNIPDQQA